MKCNECSAETVVIETRGERRRRECLGVPAHRFTTVEIDADEAIRLRALRAQLAELRALLDLTEPA